MHTILKLIISIAVCLAVGGVSGYLTAAEIPAWYSTLNKPSFNPPNWIFAPVWTTLYVLMGIALWMVWKSNVADVIKNKAIFFFSVQLIFNFFWSVIFFHYHQPALAFAEILLMWLFILLTIISFHAISRPALYLMIPYLCWVSFAAVLNFAIWRLN